MNSFFKQVSLWIVLLMIAVLAWSQFSNTQRSQEKLTVRDFEQALKDANIKRVSYTMLGDQRYDFKADFISPVKGNNSIRFYYHEVPKEWLETLERNGVTIEPKMEDTLWMGLLYQVVPLILIIGVFWFFMFRQMQGGSNKALSFGKSRARLINQSDKPVTFNDVAGVDEAKEELQEIIDFLKDPKKFSRLGGKIPKGVLLVGPPGSGKTLLARAVAGEANVPFFSISGSDFVEMFVGVGASRVRDLFQQGQKHAPCIIFIDEIDAVGRQRGAGLGGGHDEREQTLNQLLVEMDGFNTSEGVILMAATNRPDVLDRALLRPGRFDRQVVVSNPDINGREAILHIHIRNNGLPLDDDVDVRKMARGTPGFSGADLANMVNEAALLAARRNKDKVNMQDFEDAKDRVLMGPERRSLAISEKEKRLTAVHEAGHVLVGRLTPHTDPIHKATIIPRGPALGLTSWLPTEDRHNVSKSYCLATLRMAMGGRAAEEVVFNEFSSGAAGDLRSSTERAHLMVCEWGMSDLGPISFGANAEVFLGRDILKERNFSEETASAVDNEIHRLLNDAYADAKDLILKNRPILDALAQELYEKETLEADEIDEIIRANGGQDLIPPPPPKEPKHRDPLTPAPIPVKPERAPGRPVAQPGDVVPGTA
ncbi:MAG TPA: ATP-dependent zinc metalloprotease FtsH [Candidatus Hydrogenedentes bacterium]|nr:ATP-dependent zinc metalloprotease FtsH [Candidatus Hydrogenedentota bacterium]HPC17115.1 ATP-dependent zinc metalloprotease FtsH [Candidatus Hydrogenedentota bacterium]HRT21016.1 ATP-dependent zinc metalloprotease FtsH [Candidatus Hydrogenedentota bacterium]HRT65845.1 ATP-dependent zinc metalloprotease FtsH [Candidatus Hydrogenedentota bacterium]